MSLEHTVCPTVLTLMFGVWKPIVKCFNDGAFERGGKNKKKKKKKKKRVSQCSKQA